MRKQFSEPTEYASRTDPSTYQTGHTMPPKYYRGVIAILMMAVIFLLGLASALGVINLRLLLESERHNASQAPVSVYVEGNGASDPTDAHTATPPALPQAPSVEVPLAEPAPQAQPSQEQILSCSSRTTVSVQCRLRSGEVIRLPGVIVDAAGYILTGAVANQAEHICVFLPDGTIHPAALVGADGFSDLAVIYIRADGLTAAEFVDSDRLRPGDFLGSVEDGSKLNSGTLQTRQHHHGLGTGTLTVMHTGLGSFHGPLYNAHGQLAGFGVPFLESCCDHNGGGLALSSASVKNIVEQLIRQGYVRGRPTLGAQLEELEKSHQRYFGLPSGLVVTSADPSGTLLPGDILTGINGQPVTDWHSYYRLLWNTQSGDLVKLTLFREGRQLQLELTVSLTGL